MAARKAISREKAVALATVSSLTPEDIRALTDTVEKAFLQAAKKMVGVEKEYVAVLKSIADTLHDLKLLVEFDHERRLQALEDYLNQ